MNKIGSQENLCQAVIKTGKRSGKICLYRRNKYQMYCGYHDGHISKIRNSTPIKSGQEYKSKSIQTECPKETDIKIHNDPDLQRLVVNQKEIINLLNEKMTTSPENHTVYMMSCLTAYMDVQFQTLSEQIQKLKEIISQSTKTNHNPRFNSLDRGKAEMSEPQRMLEKTLQLYLRKIIKSASNTENISQFLKGNDIILSSPSKK
jgi:hypothetical protein